MDATFPKISVVTVCYNAAHLLKRTIESVLEQTYEAIEFIIVDGATSDNTIEMIKNFQHQDRLRYISEPDSGIYEAMNKGIKNATGDLIIFLNAGDSYLMPTVLKEAVSKMNLKTADIFFGRILWEDPANNNAVLTDNDFTTYDWDLKSSNFPHPATFYKKKMFREIGLFNEAFMILGDYEWNARALVKYNIPFQYIDVAIARFRADGISNDPANAARRQQETQEIFKNYFMPTWLFSSIEKKSGHESINRIKEKVLAKLYHKKLKRKY